MAKTSGDVIKLFLLRLRGKFTRPISNCGKNGVLPNGLQHFGIKVSGTDLCANINR